MFPHPYMSDEERTSQAKEMIQILAIAGCTRSQTIRLALRMRMIANRMSDDEFNALKQGIKIVPPRAT